MTTKKNLIRQTNLNRVLSLLYQHQKLYSSEIVEATKISMVTINSLVKELVDDGFLFEHPNKPREIGRPATQYEFNYDRKHSLLFVFREENKQLYVDIFTIDLKGERLAKQTRPFFDVSPSAFQLLIANHLKSASTIASLGFSIPAKISEGMITSSWYEKMDHWPIHQLIEEVTDLPYHIQNDAHLFTIGHCLLKQLPLSETIVGIYYPQNSMPGVTLLAKSSLIEGHDSLAGEAKYFPMFLDQGSPETPGELAENLSSLIATYNALIAPDKFVLAIDPDIKPLVEESLAQNLYLAKQPNSPLFIYLDDLETSIVLGLHWLIYHHTPFDLACY
ncbi:ROK family transcriptional regulator [Candidatus Enterococcus mangumiae]|uniref:ROK family protein n=1 Tax=Candidatus Enterococcus mangumiae TaxID=2230878 RepID=A0ABZ2STR2_9ENTE|nr:ROK family transcriptional regulator [Enterococcus sp. DIV1094]MBO0490083.1 ROK family transcriptional regulator [Enterococcus sp. DIV1094]